MGTTVMVPLEYHNVGLNAKAIYHCIEIFFFVIALTLPFEIRDLKFDELDLSTIPQNIGIRNTKWLGTGLIIAAGIFAYFQNYINDSDLPVTLGIFALTAISIWASDKEQGSYYASFWVEGIPILWLILLLVV